MNKRLRLIGGTRAGETLMVDSDRPDIRLPVRKEMDLSAYRPDSVVQPIRVELERYTAHTLKFGDEYEHHYGVHESMRFVDAVNALWDLYSKVNR